MHLSAPFLRTLTRTHRRHQIIAATLWLRQNRAAHYAAIVAGAGPAGLAVVGNLLEQLRKPDEKILWVDPDFKGGRLNKQWREVPSNTKAHLFVDYAKALQPFREVLEKHRERPNAVSELEKLPGDKGCDISYAADMCVMLSDGVRTLNDVDTREGKVEGASWDEKTQSWTVELHTSTPISTSTDSQPTHTTPSTPLLILCTGSKPSTLPLPIPNLQTTKLTLDTALTPSQLSSILPTSTLSTVAVIGASHSAVLVLLNLFNLARTTHPQLKVKWFTRNELRYAEYRDGWIKRDNTGLKGIAAEFARENLEGSKLSSSEAGRVIAKIDCSGGHDAEMVRYREHLPGCEFIVQATGFTPNKLPDISIDGKVAQGVRYDPETGALTRADGKGETKIIPGAFGAGIAFPQKVTDPEGRVEYAVGLWKFMRYLRGTVGRWVEEVGRAGDRIEGGGGLASEGAKERPTATSPSW